MIVHKIERGSLWIDTGEGVTLYILALCCDDDDTWTLLVWDINDVGRHWTVREFKGDEIPHDSEFVRVISPEELRKFLFS